MAASRGRPPRLDAARLRLLAARSALRGYNLFVIIPFQRCARGVPFGPLGSARAGYPLPQCNKKRQSGPGKLEEC